MLQLLSRLCLVPLGPCPIGQKMFQGPEVLRERLTVNKHTVVVETGKELI